MKGAEEDMDWDYQQGDHVRVIVSGRYGGRRAVVQSVGKYCVDVKIDYNGAVVPYDRKEIELAGKLSE